MTRVLVVASTFPASESDPVPAFVRDQIIAMKNIDSSLEFSVLAPHDNRSSTVDHRSHEYYEEYRFHYALPYSIEKLAGRGIMPALQANPLNYLLIPALFIGEFIALYSLVRRFKPAIIYAHWFTPQAINARLVGAITSTPFVFTTHASDVSVWHKIPLLGPIIVRSNVRKSTAFTAVSRRSMDKLASFFKPKEWERLKQRSQIIPMGVDLPKSTPQHKCSKTQPHAILFIGRLAEKKGVQYLLPAFKDLLKDSPTARLTIAGDGPWLEKIKAQSQSLGLDDVVAFPGYVSGAKKKQYIDSHTVYVVPSIVTKSGDAEGLPVSLMEGLAAGKICVASNESGADDIISDGKDGFLVPQKDTAKLTSALQSALSLTEEKRSEMSSLARETAKQFSWSTIARHHINFLLKDKA